MIRQKMMLKTYPSKTVLEDVATRSGPPTPNSFTPFIGKADVLREQFCGSQMERFNIDGFLMENASFEFDPTKIVENKSVGIMEIEEREERQFLEDFITDGNEAESVKRWFIQACISYKKRKESSYRKVDRTYSAVAYGDDEDSALDPRMLETNRGDYKSTQEEYDLALRKLPFYIKAIWTYSKVYSANLFSFIAAYMDLIKNRKKTMNDIIVNYFADYTTYMFKLDGTFKRAFEHQNDIKTERYKKVTDIFCYPHKHREIMSLVNGFMDVCDILQINFEKQDTMIFNADFINKLVCTYIPTNEEYLTYYGEVDAEVMYAIKSNNLYSKTKLDIYSDPNSSIAENNLREFVGDLETRLKILHTTLKMAPNKLAYRLFEGDKQLAIKNINEMFTILNNGNSIDMSPYLNFNGFLVKDSKGDALMMNTDALGKCNGVPKYDVFFTTTGSVIVRTIEADDLIFMPASDVIETLEEVINASRRKDRWLSI